MTIYKEKEFLWCKSLPRFGQRSLRLHLTHDASPIERVEPSGLLKHCQKFYRLYQTTQAEFASSKKLFLTISVAIIIRHDVPSFSEDMLSHPTFLTTLDS